MCHDCVQLGSNRGRGVCVDGAADLFVGHHAARGARVGAAPAAARGAHSVDGSDLRGERVEQSGVSGGRRLPRLVARVLRGVRHLQLHALPPQLPAAPAEPSRDGAQGQDPGTYLCHAHAQSIIFFF
jgi:hypothetical protein